MKCIICSNRIGYKPGEIEPSGHRSICTKCCPKVKTTAVKAGHDWPPKHLCISCTHCHHVFEDGSKIPELTPKERRELEKTSIVIETTHCKECRIQLSCEVCGKKSPIGKGCGC